jgi:hypothetical protein
MNENENNIFRSYFYRTLFHQITTMLYRILDIFFVVFHTIIILFNLFGWIWKKTRLANLVLLLLTGGSWLFLGMIVGTLGYCPLTDWHFSILEKLGHTDLPVSYVKYLADRLAGSDFNPHLIDSITLYSFLAALLISVVLNINDRYKSRITY